MTDPDRSADGSGTPTWRVYVAPDCPTCRTSLELVETVRQVRPGTPIEVIDLTDDPDEPLPQGVVGTPTHMLDDEVVWLGNPDLTELLAALDGEPAPPRRTGQGPDRERR